MRLAPPPRFWFLPTVAAAALFLGLSAFHAEEDPNDPFVYDRTESVLHLSLNAPGGTSLSPYDSPVAVGVLLERYSWQIWRQPSTGLEQYRDPSTLPESGATITLTRSPEMGTLAESTLTTDSDGRAWTTFSPDGVTSHVSVEASSGDSTASLSFTITSTPGWEETWYLSQTEATLVAEITSALSTQNVAPGENRDLSLSVRYETWDVMASNLGNTRIENFTSAPAEGASVIWTMESGDGAVSGYGTTDSGGLAQGSFTMGSGESILRAEIAYATGQATTATLTFSPQPPTGGSGASEWTHIRSETVPTIVNLSADGPTELSSGETRQFSGQVQGEVWDIWTDGTTEDRRYNYTTSLSFMPLFADVGFGVGSIGSPNLTTDGNGWFSTSFMMGTGPAQIALRFDPLAPPAATIDFAMASSNGFDPGTGSGNTDLWSYLYTEGYYSIQDFVIDGPTYDLAAGDVRTISGTLVWVQWEVWGNSSGSTEQRNNNASPVAWTTVNAAVSTGDGTLSSTGLTTGSLGEFSTSFTMGSENSTVVLSVDGPQGTSTYVGFTRPAPPEQWLPIRTESSIVVSLAADDNTVSREPGQSLPLRATVTATTWEIRESDRTGEQREFDHQTGPAIGATVSFTHLSGPGSLSTWQAETDADGIAEGIFVRGENTATIRASATFQTANSEAEIVVSPDLWIYQSSEEELELALSLHGDPANPTGIGATLQVRRTETWRNLATGTTETRHQSISPAENGQITFSPAEGADVTFGTNPLFTDVSGNAITEYRSSGSCPIIATASFAGMTATSTIAVPQGRGLSGTDGGGTDGGGNDGTGTQNQNETSGGDNNNNTLPSDPETLSNVTTDLVRRTHSVGWVERGSDGPSGEVTKKYYFRATLERNITDENGDPQTKIEEVEGERQYEGEILLQWYLQGWYLVGQVEYFERDEVELVASGGGSAIGDLLLAGFTSFDTEYSILRCLITAETFAEFEGNDHVSAGLVNGALASSFNGDPWEEPERLYFTTLNGTEGPGTDRADYVASPHYPEASWSEYWLQAGSFVAHDTVAKRTFLIHATRRNHQFVKTGEWVGTVTFEIVGNGSVSNRTPILSGFAETDAMGWLQPTEDGRLLVKPDVVKGAFHEVSLLPVEVVELSPKVKDEEGNNIEGSEHPSTGRPLTPFVELNPVTDRIAHRELKVRIGEALKGKTVTWTLDAVPDATPATIRGQWTHSTTHPDRFEASATYGANGFTRLSQASGRTTVGDDGFTAVRVNVPPVGFNQVRIRIQIEGMDTPIDLIDMEVPGVVVIDPGHGGTADMSGSNWNNATSPSGVLEKAMALDYGLALRDSLRAIRDTDRLNLRVFMTREVDQNITGAARAAVARDNGADIIHIIHFNASAAHTARGTLEVYRTTNNVFPQQDTILSDGIITRMVTAMTPFDAGANHRARVANDTAVASDANNGNTAAYCPVRTAYIEVEFIDYGAHTTTPDDDLVDILLNTGPNATAVKTAVADAMRDGILHDLRNHQPQP